MASQLDILCLGDTAVDAFIRLKDAKVHCNLKTAECELCVRFGDKIPFESVTVVPGVGNAANAAVAGARLGLRTALAGKVGDDAYAKDCINALRAEGVDTSKLLRERGKRTNYHFVLWYESERTILVNHEEYSYAFPRLHTPPRFMYLSSLAENSLSYHGEIAAYLRDCPEVKLAFQPGTFQMKLGAELLRDIYQHTYLFFCNKEEARRILATARSEMKELLSGIRALGPRIAIITDGRNGAWAQDERGTYTVPMYPDPKPPLERTGAGDAFASTIVSALALGEPLTEALAWGPINSMSVVQEIGAQKGLLDRNTLKRLRAEAPEEYRVREVL